MAVRSQRLIAGYTTGPGYSQTIVVPAAAVVLVKHMLLHNFSTATVSVEVNGLIGGSTLVPLWVLSLASKTTQMFVPWLALNPTDRFYLYLSGAQIGYWISGAVLPGAVPLAVTADIELLPAAQG